MTFGAHRTQLPPDMGVAVEWTLWESTGAVTGPPKYMILRSSHALSAGS